jgi:hypothetical protein
VKHFASPDFWGCYRLLPTSVQKVADKNFELLRSNARHSSLHLKKVGLYWSARVGENYRAVGKMRPEGIVWSWIGPHSDYDKILKQ